jgi:hypothetical protein
MVTFNQYKTLYLVLCSVHVNGEDRTIIERVFDTWVDAQEYRDKANKESEMGYMCGLRDYEIYYHIFEKRVDF